MIFVVTIWSPIVALSFAVNVLWYLCVVGDGVGDYQEIRLAYAYTTINQQQFYIYMCVRCVSIGKYGLGLAHADDGVNHICICIYIYT